MSEPESKQLYEIMDAISDDEKAVRRAAFDLILGRSSASVGALSKRTGLTATTVAEAVSRLADLGIVVSGDDGSVVGCRGLTIVPGNHRLHMFDYDYYGWCAEDVIGIPAALKVDARVDSTCYQCGETVTVEIKQGEAVSSAPKEVRLWIADAQVGRSIVGNF